MYQQLSLFEPALSLESPTQPDLDSYDRVLVAFSGGKDSIGCVLTLLESGVDSSRIELHHHLVDGREGSTLFDWPVTEDYCRQFAKAFNIPIYFSWLEGGLEREMCRNNTAKAPTHFETPNGMGIAGGKGQPDTRRKFPAKTTNLQIRWCSPYAKINVLDISINNQKRFNNSRTLVVTGERAEESPVRAKYPAFAKHRTDNRESVDLERHVDHWRPVHHMNRTQIWQLIKKWLVNVHPAYHLGFGRLSCQRCIFGSPNQWATNYLISPVETERMHQYELMFGYTLDNKLSIPEMALKGKPYSSLSEKSLKLALGKEYTEQIILTPDTWWLPSGAFGEDVGPD